MKNIILIIIVLSAFSCRAQNIVAIDSNSELYIHNSGIYYKDVANDFNNFVGTWKYENGNTSFTIILKKEEHLVGGFGYFDDILSGEFQYIENGTELINTLNLINNSAYSGYKHHISGGLLLRKYHHPKCDDCSINEKRVELHIKNTNTINRISGYMVLRHVNDNGTEKIEMYLKDSNFIILDESAPTTFEVPFGNYTLIKQ